MGLEVTELMMACEEEFGVNFVRQPERRLNRIETVGDLYLYIMELIPDPKPRRCPWVPVFFALRRTLTEQLGLNKRTVRPNTPLTELLPDAMRRQTWNQIRRALPFDLPALEHAVTLRVRGLVDHVVRSSYPGFGPDGRPWDVDSVWDALREIVSERLDVDIAIIGPETHFWHDLGAG